MFGRGAWARAEALARDACEVAAQDPAVFEVEEAQRALRSAVPEMADALLASPAADHEPAPTGGPARRTAGSCAWSATT